MPQSTSTGGRGNSGIFLDFEPRKSYAAFVLDHNALTRGDIIRNDVKKGYIVQTQADIDTYEAKKNDLTKAKAAFVIVALKFFREITKRSAMLIARLMS